MEPPELADAAFGSIAADFSAQLLELGDVILANGLQGVVPRRPSILRHDARAFPELRGGERVQVEISCPALRQFGPVLL